MEINKRNILLEGSGLIILVLLIILNSIFTKNFLQVSTLWNMLMQIFPVMLISFGMTMVIGTGGIDISVGSIMAFTSIVVAKFIIIFEWNIYLSVFIALGAAALFGIFNGFIIAKFNIQPIIVTLILMMSGRGIAQLVNDAMIISFYDNAFTEIGLYKIAGQIPIQVVILLIMFFICRFIIQNTTFGKNIEAIGDNRTAARLVGVDMVKTIIIVYVMSALLTGTAAIFETARICAADPNTIGRNIEMDCIAAVAIGGTSMNGGRLRLTGTVIGALIIQFITTMVNMNNIQYAYSLIIKAAIILIVLYIQNRNEG